MQSVALLLTLFAVGQPLSRSTSAAPRSAVVPNCLVTLIEDVQVPAQEAGVLVELNVREGMVVKTGDQLARLDDSQAQSEKNVALFEQQAAQAKAESDIDVRYARAATKVAEAEYMKALDAVRKVPGSVASVELNRLQLTHRRAELQIEQAQLERKIAALTSQTRASEVQAADNNIQRRHIKSPINGVVVNISRRAGEWVQPGDPVLRILGVDKLRVEGFLNAAAFSPDQIDGQTVHLDVELAGGRHVKYRGRVTFVSPLVEAGGEYRVWAEVDNVTTNNEPNLLRPGLISEMTIETK